MSGYRQGYAAGYEQALRDLFLARQKSPVCHYRRVGHHLWAWRKAVLDAWAGRPARIFGEDLADPQDDPPPTIDVDELAAKLTAEARRVKARRRRQPEEEPRSLLDLIFSGESIIGPLLETGRPRRRRR